MATNFFNHKYPYLGDVKITFNDNTTETRNIQTLGETIFDTGTTRTAVKAELLGQSFPVSTLPAQITYPNSTVGMIGVVYNVTPHITWHTDEQI